MAKLKIALAQINTLVGDVPGNARQIIAAIESARDTHGADLVVFQELALSGYPPGGPAVSSGPALSAR